LNKQHWLRFAGAALFPLCAAGIFILIANLQAWFRYDMQYFAPEYQSTYEAPGAVASALESVIRTDDQALYKELTALRFRPRPIEPNPNMRLTVLLQVDEAGYFQYLYFDVKTYRRSTYHIKQVMDRWIVVPQDVYFYWDSGRWVTVFAPLALIWWGALAIGGSAYWVYRSAAKFREQRFRISKR
jgi:hypothetical protein